MGVTRSSKPLVCLVVPGHLTATPRLLKEATALMTEGYRIHTVSLNNFPPNSLLDDAILSAGQWTATRIPASRGFFGLARRIIQRSASRMPAKWLTHFNTLAARAKQAETGLLTRASLAVPADYYIGHCLGALSAVASAAKHRRARYGFDLEDFHEAETVEVEQNPKLLNGARSLLKRHLPAASHLTAASPLIAAAYERHYGVKATIILNVFPLDHAPPKPVTAQPISQRTPAILYWVSQTIGPGRGLEEIIAGLARVRTPVELHLRGHVTPDYITTVDHLAKRLGCLHAIKFLPFSPPSEVVRLAAPAALGLSTEQNTPYNRAICLTNKVFIYPLAGVPQLISNTPAQNQLAAELGDAALKFSLSDSYAIAATIDNYLASRERVARARHHAWSLGQSRFNWDFEKSSFLRTIEGLKISAGSRSQRSLKWTDSQ